jgi:putative ABC transport system permease protein
MFGFILRKAFSSLKTLGTSALIISLAVFFSSFSAMALITLANQFYAATVGDARIQLGSDVSIYLPSDPVKQKEVIAFIAELKEKGIVSKYTRTGATMGTYTTSSKNNTLDMTTVEVVYDQNYPIVDVVKLSNNKSIFDTVSTLHSAVITKDLAQKFNVQQGDTLSLIAYDIVNTINVQVGAIVERSDSNTGGTIYLSEATISNGLSGLSNKLLIVGDESKIAQELKAKYPDDSTPVFDRLNFQTVSQYKENNAKGIKAFTIFFRGLGVFGLFIGSLGIASSMQVIISRRRREIGILKAIGYKKTQVILSFLTELVILAIPGIIVGILAGYLFANYLTNILMQVGLNFAFDYASIPLTALLVFFASTVSAVIFAFSSVENYASLSPALVLKDIEIKQSKKNLFKKLVIFVIAALLFTGLSIIITEDLMFGCIFVAVVSVGLFVASLIFRVIFWVILRLPLKTKNYLEISWINLRSSYKKMMLSIVTIFAGLLAISIIISIISASKNEMQKRSVDITSPINIISINRGNQTSGLERYLKTLNGVKQYLITYKYTLPAEKGILDGRPIASDYIDLSITEGSLKDGMYVLVPLYQSETEKIGDKVKIQGQELEISGYIDIPENKATFLYSSMPNYVVSTATFLQITKSDQAYREFAYIVTSSDKENDVANDLRNNYKPELLLSNGLVERFYNSKIDMIVNMIISIASLALLAGGILLLNAVSLDVLARRRSFGLLKVIGFDNAKVTTMLLMEYGFIFIIIFLMTYAFSYLGVTLFSTYSKMLFGYTFKVPFLYVETLLLIVVVAVIIMCLIYLISRKYLNTKPADVLRYE